MPRTMSAEQRHLVHADSELPGTLDTHSSDSNRSGSVNTGEQLSMHERTKGTKENTYVDPH